MMIHSLTPGVNKFILVQNESNELCIISKALCNFPDHQDIVDSEQVIFKVVGGGWLVFDQVRKCIRISGKSYRYGQAEHEVVRQLLQQDSRFSDYKIKLENC